MSEALKNTRKGHLTFWNEALEAKLEGKGKPFGKDEFDKFLGDYNVRARPRAANLLLNDSNRSSKTFPASFLRMSSWPPTHLLKLS